jgi:hypothetical protein
MAEVRVRRYLRWYLTYLTDCTDHVVYLTSSISQPHVSALRRDGQSRAFPEFRGMSKSVGERHHYGPSYQLLDFWRQFLNNVTCHVVCITAPR